MCRWSYVRAPSSHCFFLEGYKFFSSGGQFSLTCKNHDIPLRFLKAGAFYEETCTQFGMYNPNGGLGWGCNSPVPRKDGASQNSYIRFHFTGALELSLMVLDFFDATGDAAALQKYLPIASNVVEVRVRAVCVRVSCVRACVRVCVRVTLFSSRIVSSFFFFF